MIFKLCIGNDRKPFRTFALAGYRVFFELFASANTQANAKANTCAYLSLMRLVGSSSSLDKQSLSVFNETSSSITSLDQANQPCSTIQALTFSPPESQICDAT